jgi:hypothetical protein
MTEVSAAAAAVAAQVTEAMGALAAEAAGLMLLPAVKGGWAVAAAVLVLAVLPEALAGMA